MIHVGRNLNAHELRSWYHGLLQSSLDQSRHALLLASIAAIASSIVTITTIGVMLGIVIGRINPSTFGAIG
jgi:hypothetical protein